MHVVVRCLVAAAIIAVPAVASAAPPAGHKPQRTARVQKEKAEPKACLKPVVEVVTGSESASFSLAKCDGTAAPQAVDQLSILARPSSAAKPKMDKLEKTKGPNVAPGVRRIDSRLVQRLELAIEHFAKGSQAPRIQLVSGYRPKSAGSFHQSGRALDFRIDGVTNEALVAFCKTLPDTGCGYYPNSLFVHMDVRDAGAGHVAWVDASRPGEAPRYVSSWPPPASEANKLPALPAEPAEDTRADGRRHKDGHVYYF